MISRLLVSCPTCQNSGRRNILGEVKDGYLLVLRFHNGYTKIRGEFEVLCNICDELVYFKTIGSNINYNAGLGTIINNTIGSIFAQ